jgi:hypothetical protein
MDGLKRQRDGLAAAARAAQHGPTLLVVCYDEMHCIVRDAMGRWGLFGLHRAREVNWRRGLWHAPWSQKSLQTLREAIHGEESLRVKGDPGAGRDH